MVKIIRMSFFVFVFSHAYLGWSQEKLMLIGGGNRPPEALEKFSDLAQHGRILIIGWASEEAEESARILTEEFDPVFKGNFDYSYFGPLSLEGQDFFLDQLSKATGVFFGGGDQSKIMNVFESPGGDRLRQRITELYEKGIVMGGTSAGTAIMSEAMIVGDMIEAQTPLRAGLAFLPSQIIVDQHFSQRRRRKRLLSALNQTQKPIGIGVDEDTSLFVLNKETCEVVGKHRVKVFTKNADTARFDREVYRDGDTFSL